MSQQFVEALLFTIIIMFNNGAYKVESGIVEECPPYEKVVPLLEKGLNDWCINWSCSWACWYVATG